MAAAQLDLTVGFGDEVGINAEAGSSPLFIPLEVDRSANGYYLVQLRDKRGRLLAVEGHALASLDSAD
jgi:hypothetical protein